MRIVIDARMMGPENTRGIGRYTQELIQALLQSAPEHRYIIVTRTSAHVFADHPSVETVVADIPWYGFREQCYLPKILSRIQADVFHFPHWNVPLLFRGPFVVTVHDLLLRHVPASAKISTRHPLLARLKRLGYRINLASAVTRAKKILVPTQVVAQDVARFYPRAADKIVVTGEGMPELKMGAMSHELQGPAEEYLLCVGAAYPHKGLQDVLDAWPKISQDYPQLGLKIVGELDVFMQKSLQYAVSHQLARVEFLGRVSDAVLNGLYSRTRALVFPSHFEGFGLPPLEALAHGCPVICSDIPVLREVLGDVATTFFRVGDQNAILGAVQRVLSDQDSVRKQAMEAAQHLALRHTWLKTARATLEVYTSVIRPHGRNQAQSTGRNS